MLLGVWPPNYKLNKFVLYLTLSTYRRQVYKNFKFETVLAIYQDKISESKNAVMKTSDVLQVTSLP